jgi:hypothetical protein
VDTERLIVSLDWTELITMFLGCFEMPNWNPVSRLVQCCSAAVCERPTVCKHSLIIVGRLLCLACWTRLDISLATYKLSRGCSSPGQRQAHMVDVKHRALYPQGPHQRGCRRPSPRNHQLLYRQSWQPVWIPGPLLIH